MKVLLDHCIDWRLSRSLLGHDVKGTRDMGWETLTNGVLLARAATQFDVMITVDQNIKHQQNAASLPLAVVMLVVKSNRLADALPLVPKLLDCLTTIAPCTFVEVTG